MTERVPITAAEAIAHKHGYDQVIVYARRVGLPGLEWVTTYGKTEEHSGAAARIGAAIGGQVVGPIEEANARAALAEARFLELSQGFGNALADVAIERRRQVEAEGWTPEHDDGHDKGEMARAGAGYAFHAGLSDAERAKGLPQGWPAGWAFSWWKPSDRRRDLVKAAALLIAEIERLDRREAAARAERQP